MFIDLKSISDNKHILNYDSFAALVNIHLMILR